MTGQGGGRPPFPPVSFATGTTAPRWRRPYNHGYSKVIYIAARNKITTVLWSLTGAVVKLLLFRDNNLHYNIPHTTRLNVGLKLF